MMSTFVAPVTRMMESTFCWICAAVVAFDWRKLYDQFTSSALVHPSALKRLTIVVHVELLAFHPCTNRIGSCVSTGGGGFGLPPRAKLGDVGASGSNGESEHAATVSSATSAAARATARWEERSMVGRDRVGMARRSVDTMRGQASRRKSREGGLRRRGGRRACSSD